MMTALVRAFAIANLVALTACTVRETAQIDSAGIGRDSAFGPVGMMDSTGKIKPLPEKR